MAIFLHEHKEFPALLRIVEEETGILAHLVEKDYWIMHCLYGLKAQGYDFQLKGGTSLSKGYGIIHRFSEDIDLHINPPVELGINENPNNSNPKNIQKKKEYYNTLAKEILIPGITTIERDSAFDDEKKYNSGGIRLIYEPTTTRVEGIKQGILLEAGYDNVVPNSPVLISCWAYDRASSISDLDIIDNRATDIICYDPRYTFVEKLQTISTKFRKEMNTGKVTTNYMRQYYDVYCLLGDQRIIDFIGTAPYQEHKKTRFPEDDFNIPISDNEAFLLKAPILRENFRQRYEATAALYYKGQPSFDDLLGRIDKFLERL
ncbi:MAG TPA: nucleotidyl transferase AbiEii/AbiGii toxin family protein [Puia sp.]|nr:nucleotidyl transferase AbiEii/AbiGii toxin family protein [Puia sp.]